jgi:hypothetical protein
VAENLAYIVLGWLAGEGDFGKAICSAANCGADVDCTAASLGALLAIIDPDSISEEWRAPVSGGLVLSPGVVGITAPRDLDAFTEWTLALHDTLKQAEVGMGEVLAQRAATTADAPIRLPVDIAWHTDRGLLEREEPPALAGAERAERSGHWQRFDAAAFRESVMIQRFMLHLPVKREALLMSWISNGDVAWWLAGEHGMAEGLSHGLEDFGVAEKAPVPSFHRAGRFVQRTGPLPAGDHELVVALTPRATEKPVDLVLGIGNVETKLWAPWAVAAGLRV